MFSIIMDVVLITVFIGVTSLIIYRWISGNDSYEWIEDILITIGLGVISVNILQNGAFYLSLLVLGAMFLNVFYTVNSHY